jgi:hypothetical protein
MMRSFGNPFQKAWRDFLAVYTRKDPPSFDQEPWLYAPGPSELAADGEAHEVPGPGWQPDPLKEASQRWWDGDEWTSATRNLA